MPDEPAPVVYQWQYRAWEKDPSKRLMAVLFMFAAGAMGVAVLHHILFALIGMVVVFVSTAELFLPVTYTLDEKQARQKIGISTTAILWSDVKRLIEQDDGVRLSPFASPERLDAFRGLFLRYAGNRDEVLGKIRELWKSDASTVDRGTDGGAERWSDREGCPGDPQTSDGDARNPGAGDA